MRIGLAFRLFWAALFSREKATRLEKSLEGSSVADPSLPSSAQRKIEPMGEAAKGSVPVKDQDSKSVRSSGARSDALTLLSTLQREARWVDLVQEPLDAYSDAQVGAAARDVLRDSRKVLDRLFAIEPILTDEEGEVVGVPENGSPTRFCVIGKADKKEGTLVHRGWQATRCQLPQWTGSQEDAMVLAPAQIETN